MKKRQGLFISALLALPLLVACNPNNGVLPGNDGELTIDPNNPGNLAKAGDWNAVASYDYRNMLIMDDDSVETDMYYVYNLGPSKYMRYWIDSNTNTPVYKFYADYEDKNYLWVDLTDVIYWECNDCHELMEKSVEPTYCYHCRVGYNGVGEASFTKHSQGGKGWVYKDPKYEYPYSLYLEDLHMPTFLDSITEDDVEYNKLMQGFYVKDKALARVKNRGLTFTEFEHNRFETIFIGVEQDESQNWRINKIYCYDSNDDDNSPYVKLTLKDFGTTTITGGRVFPEMPNEHNIKELWELDGVGYVPNVDPETLSLEVLKMKDGSDVVYDGDVVVLEVGQSVEMKLTVGPENVNRESLYSWVPERSDFSDGDGNLNEDYDVTVALFGHDPDFNKRCNYLFANIPGETEVYVKHENIFKYDEHGDYETIYSNKIKVRVNEPKEIDDEGALYQFDFTDYEQEYNDAVWGSSSGYYQTSFSAMNTKATIERKPNYEITGFRATLNDGKNTEAFSDTNKIVMLSPMGGNASEGGLYSYLAIDTKDQLTSSVSFYYSLHKSNQVGNLTSSFGEDIFNSAYIQTSEDGVNWVNASRNLQPEMMVNFKQNSSSENMRAYLLEETVTPSRYVRFYVTARTYANNFSICLDKVTLNHTEYTHVDTPYTEVNSVTINSDGVSTMRKGKENSITLSATVNPSNATNQKLYWTSSSAGSYAGEIKHDLVKITRNYDGTVTLTAQREGSAVITVYTDEKGINGEPIAMDTLEITVLGNAVLPTELGTNAYSANATTFVVFDAAKNKIDVTYLKNGLPIMDSLYLSDINEATKLYTFTSESSRIYLLIDLADLSSVKITSNGTNKSNIKGNEIGFTKLNLVTGD